jgi:hypothetical protein
MFLGNSFIYKIKKRNINILKNHLEFNGDLILYHTEAESYWWIF